MTNKKTPLERLLSPIEGDLEKLSGSSDELNESVHKFISYIANGLLLPAIDIAERNNYPASLRKEISKEKFAESMRNYQRAIYFDLQEA